MVWSELFVLVLFGFGVVLMELLRPAWALPLQDAFLCLCT